MDIIEKIESNRKKASEQVAFFKQKLFEQYFTPNDIAHYMSDLFSQYKKKNIYFIIFNINFINELIFCFL